MTGMAPAVAASRYLRPSSSSSIPVTKIQHPLTRYTSFATVPRAGGFHVAILVNNLKRPEPKALATTLEKLAARFGNRLVTSQAVREQHGHTTTWLVNQPPDAVVMA